MKRRWWGGEGEMEGEREGRGRSVTDSAGSVGVGGTDIKGGGAVVRLRRQ